MTASLEGCRLKIERAKEHLDALDQRVRGFLDDKPYRFTYHFDTETREKWAEIRIVREPPDEWNLDLSEIVHHLRSALDHLVYQLAIASGSDPSADKTYFPIFLNDRAYWTPGRNRPSNRDIALTGVEPRFRRVVDSYQPYQRGKNKVDDPLAVLAWLDNADKHKTSHTGFVRLGEASATVRSPAVSQISEYMVVQYEIGDAIWMLYDGAELFRFSDSTGAEPEMEVNPETTVGIGFTERQLTLKRVSDIAGYVEKVVARFVPMI